MLQSNLDETLRLIKIVEKLFFISKTDHSLIKIKKEKIELNSFILNAIESMKTVAEERNVKLKFSGDEKTYAEIDAGLMNQVLYNLIENAIKFSDPNEVVNIQLEKINYNKVICFGYK